MKTNFKKMAMAMGVTGALAGVSIPAHAIIEAVPGEAALIPLMVHGTHDGENRTHSINTVVRIGVPKSVGNDVILNYYTAPNSSPTNGTKQAPGSEDPGAIALAKPGTELNDFPETSHVHWYFMDQRSVKRLNGTIPVSQDDVEVFDWRSLSGGAYRNKPGYMILVTDSGNAGKKADFSFTTDAWLVVDEEKATSIPTLPMSDGADVAGVGPTIENNVVEVQGGLLSPKASPLITGQPTIWSDGKPNVSVFDLPLSNQGGGTLAIIWNDRNADAKWSDITAFRFNDYEENCSGSISLPNELNLVFVGTSQYDHGGTGIWYNLEKNWSGAPGKGGSGNWRALESNWICTVNTSWASADAYTTTSEAIAALGGGKLDEGGFVKLVLPELADNSLNRPEGAALMFTIPLDGRFLAHGQPVGGIVMSHFRGAFTDAPN